jgi:hypothetical protein
MRVAVWNIRLLPKVGQSHRSLEILLYYSHPSSWTLIRNSLLLLLCCALSRMLLLRTCLSIPIHTNAQAHEYNTFVPILSFFSRCLFLLCDDDDSTSTRVVIHEFSFQQAIIESSSPVLDFFEELLQSARCEDFVKLLDPIILLLYYAFFFFSFLSCALEKVAWKEFYNAHGRQCISSAMPIET